MKKYSVLFILLLLLFLFFCGCGSPPSGSLDNFFQKSSGDVQINVTPQISYQGEDVKLSIQVLDKNGKELPVNRNEISLIFMDKAVLPIPADDDTNIDAQSSSGKIPVGMALVLEDPEYRKLFWEDRHSSWAYITSSNSGECRGEVKVRAEDYEGQTSFSFSVKKATSYSSSALVRSYSRALSGGGTEVGLFLCWEKVKGALYYNVKASSATDSSERAATGEERLDEGTLPRPAIFLGGIYGQTSTPEFLLDMEQYLRLCFWGSNFEAAPVSDKAAPTAKILYVKNCKVTPESIYPGESTTITARLECSSGWVPHNLRWQVVISVARDGVVLRTSDWVYGSNVRWVWNGKDNKGKQVPPDTYRVLQCMINATCDEKPAVLPATGFTRIIDPPLPQVAKIEFLNSPKIVDTSGNPAATVWVRVGGSIVSVAYPMTMSAKDVELPDAEQVESEKSEMPPAYTEEIGGIESEEVNTSEIPEATDVSPLVKNETEEPLEEIKDAPLEEEVTPEEEALPEEKDLSDMKAKKAQMKVTFDMNPAPSSKVTYTIRAEDQDKFITVKNSQKATFEAKSSTATQTFDLVFPKKSIQRIWNLKWYCIKAGETSEKTMEDTVFGKEDYRGIYLTFDAPQGAMKTQIPVKLLQMDADFLNGYGDKKKERARDDLVQKLFNWLKSQQFHYEDLGHNEDNNTTFRLKEFLNEKKGNCEAVSDLYHLLCNAVGIEMQVRQIYRGEEEGQKFSSNDARTWDMKENVYTNFPFKMHQIGNTGTILTFSVWDPTLYFKKSPNFAVGMNRYSYTSHLVKNNWIMHLYWRGAFSIQKVILK